MAFNGFPVQPFRLVTLQHLLSARPCGLFRGLPYRAAGWPPMRPGLGQPEDTPRPTPCPHVRPVTLPSVASGLVTASGTASVTPRVCARAGICALSPHVLGVGAAAYAYCHFWRPQRTPAFLLAQT